MSTLTFNCKEKKLQIQKQQPPYGSVFACPTAYHYPVVKTTALSLGECAALAETRNTTADLVVYLFRHEARRGSGIVTGLVTMLPWLVGL